MFASLGMYNRPELQNAYNAFWQDIRARLSEQNIPAPAHLDQTQIGIAAWLRPDMVISQTCGLPYRTRLQAHVGLIGTLDYSVKDCSPGFYCSALIVRKDERRSLAELQSATYAYNSTDSQSGFAAFHTHAKSKDLAFQFGIKSGGHENSARMVSTGQVDIAALDAITFRFLQHYEPFTDSLKVIDITEPTPGLPLITGAHINKSDTIFDAISQAIDALSATNRDLLTIKGIVKIPKHDYLAIPTPDITVSQR